MLHRIFNALRLLFSSNGPGTTDANDISSLNADSAHHISQQKLAELEDATTEALTRICDEYWNSFLITDEEQTVIASSCVHRRALELLAGRGSECLHWVRARLKHPGYDAREDAAYLIRQIAQSGQLGSAEEKVADELMVLVLRRPEEDTKESQAATAALSALSVIGGSLCLKAIRAVLTSPEWDEDDNQWDAAEILEEITGEAFMESNDPVEMAKKWLKANPDNEL